MKLTVNLLIIFFLVSCGTQSMFEGYTRHKSGVYYNLHSLGEDSVHIAPGDYVTCDLVYATAADSQFFTARRKFQLNTALDQGSFDNCFTLLNLKDSASFMIPAQQFFEKTLQVKTPDFLAGEDFLKISTKVIEVQSEVQFKREKEAFLHWIEDFGQYEKVILKQFIEQKDIDVKPTESGLYYLVLKEGSGERVKTGDSLVVHYEGKFLNGKFFDSTIKRHEPFSFIYGTEWQVIEGLEEALGYMHEGEKALFIMPSEVAWGGIGSSTGIVPPFTSLIFEVELLQVN